MSSVPDFNTLPTKRLCRIRLRLAFICTFRNWCARYPHTGQDFMSSIVEQGHDATMTLSSRLLNVGHGIDGIHIPIRDRFLADARGVGARKNDGSRHAIFFCVMPSAS